MVKTHRLSHRRFLNHPIAPGSLQQGVGADHICLDERRRIEDGAIDMQLGGKMNDGIDLIQAKKVVDQAFIANISVDKVMPLMIGDALQVQQAAGVGKSVQVDDCYRTIGLKQVVDEIRADKASATCDQDITHIPPVQSSVVSRKVRPRPGISPERLWQIA